MKFSTVVLAAAAGVAANKNVTYVTEVVDVYTTYCPAATQITHGTKTWTVTAPTTLTISDCPCTVTRPVQVTSAVVCHSCHQNGTVTPAKPTGPAVVPTAGAGKVAAGLAGVLGVAALAL
ncbi:Putative Mmc protein [[Torrubiella] hemipterigena]|uniref:Putative Mmc protein n=1 Tax=[Torrubiella] hemipterigena TaxID=1531966 RepID=A0A0A1TSY3_9HYPO|nr:Putative Mmc protein [[Torrubiella] hemipterigena]